MKTYSNLTPIPTPKFVENLRQMVESNAEVYGDRPLYNYKPDGVAGELVQMTYSQFSERLHAFATGLFEYGLNGKTVAVIGDTHPDWTISYISVFTSGGVIIPLDHDLAIDEAVNFMKIAECSAIVYTSAMNKTIEEAIDKMDFLEYIIPVKSTFEHEKVLHFEAIVEKGRAALEAGDTRYADHEIDMEKTSAILFTSGTTGTSKGVMLSNKNLASAVNSSCTATCYGVDDVFVSVLPIHHTFEFTTEQLALSNQGAQMYVCDGLRYVTRNFKDYKPTSLVLVPLYLETIHKKIWEEIRKKGLEKKVRAGMAVSNQLLKVGKDFRPKFFGEVLKVFGGNLKSIVVGGAPIDPQILRDFYAFGITVVQGYGITECSPLVSVNPHNAIKFDSVGKAVDGVEVKIVPLEDGSSKEGEILVRGDNVMNGYYKNEEATRAVFTEDGWFRTGDVGTLDRHGYLTITGRIKNIIIASNGKNVYPEELEEQLLKIPAVKECVVVGREENGSTTITAVIVPDYDVLGENTTDAAASLILKESIAQINRTLPAYKHINKFDIRHEEFEKTLTKKIKRFLVK